MVKYFENNDEYFWNDLCDKNEVILQQKKIFVILNYITNRIIELFRRTFLESQTNNTDYKFKDQKISLHFDNINEKQKVTIESNNDNLFNYCIELNLQNLTNMIIWKYIDNINTIESSKLDNKYLNCNTHFVIHNDMSIPNKINHKISN